MRKFTHYELEGNMDKDKLVPKFSCEEINPFTPPKVQMPDWVNNSEKQDVQDAMQRLHRRSRDIQNARHTHSVVDIEEEMRQQVTQMMENTPFETNREKIAHLIRLLTYRELCQISAELLKIELKTETSTSDMACVLDNWAHMVKEENSGIPSQKDKPIARQT